MKKILALTFMTMFMVSGFAMARVKYDETGRTIIYDNTIRGQQRAQQAQQINQKRQGMAAAKINYEQYTPVGPNNLKNNYIQDRK